MRKENGANGVGDNLNLYLNSNAGTVFFSQQSAVAGGLHAMRFYWHASYNDDATQNTLCDNRKVELNECVVRFMRMYITVMKRENI